MIGALPKVHRDGSVSLRGEAIGTVRLHQPRRWGAWVGGALVRVRETRALAVEELRRHDLRRGLKTAADQLDVLIKGRRMHMSPWDRGYAFARTSAVRHYAMDEEDAVASLYAAAESAGLVPSFRAVDDLEALPPYWATTP